MGSLTRRCGHAMTPQNTLRNGKLAPGCRACREVQRAKREANETPERKAERKAKRLEWSRGKNPLKGHRNARKSNCPKGHPYDSENTYWVGSSRQCKACRKARASEYYHKLRAVGGAHTDEEFRDLCELYGNRCLSCWCDLPLTKDHVTPVSKGGLNSIGNIQPLCLFCNASKKDKTIDYRS